MSFRENLRETLDFISMEQKELALKTGISLKTIENYVKKDASIPTADKAVQIAQALGVTVEYLVTGRNARERKIFIEPEVNTIIQNFKQLDIYDQKMVIAIIQHCKNRRKNRI